MKLLTYLKNLPINADKPAKIQCQLNTKGNWIMRADISNVQLKIEIGHNEFIAWLHSKKIKTDINATEYTLTID